MTKQYLTAAVFGITGFFLGTAMAKADNFDLLVETSCRTGAMVVMNASWLLRDGVDPILVEVYVRQWLQLDGDQLTGAMLSLRAAHAAGSTATELGDAYLAGCMGG